MLKLHPVEFDELRNEQHEMVAANTNANPIPSHEVIQDSSLTPGSTVGERFTLVRPLGRGAMGSVWLARHLALDIDVALKFIDSSLASQTNYVERFRREARAAAQIANPHVVSVLDYGTDERGFPFMAMEYLSGTTLGAFLAESSRLRVEVVARIVTHAARGLSKAHELGIVHRDIKPENLFLCGKGGDEAFQLKVLDFGVAKGGFTASGHGTLAGQLIGSPAYMSPEQARGYKSIDSRADLFSLGVVAYQCLTGWHPFTGSSVGELLLSVCTLDPEPATALVPGLPLAVDAWFEKALAKKRSERFASALEMSNAFCDALGPFLPASAHSSSSFPEVALKTMVTFDGRSEQVSGIVPLGHAASPRGSESRTIAVATQPALEPASLVEALAPLARIPHVLGLALLDGKGECLHALGQKPNAHEDAVIFAHARAVAETVESIHAARPATHLCARFENLTLYVRWIGSFALVVRGDASMRALLLTVGSNNLASKLESLFATTSAEHVARALGGSARAPGARETETVGEPVCEFSAEEVPTRRERPLVYRGKVVGSKWGEGERINEAHPLHLSPAMNEEAHERTRAEPVAKPTRQEAQPKKERLILYRGQVLNSRKDDDKQADTVRASRGKVQDD